MLRNNFTFFSSLMESSRLSEKRLQVDRSGFIVNFIKSMGLKNKVVTCPSGMGKTYNLGIIEKFFGLESEVNYFADAEISRDRKLCEKYQNKFPVITISFAHFQGETFDHFYRQFKEMLIALIEKHLMFLRKRFQHATDDAIQEKLRELMDWKEALAKQLTETDAQWMLHTLSRVLYCLHNKQRVILLIDDVDLPKFTNKDPKINEFISGFLVGSLQNKYIQTALITQTKHDESRFLYVNICGFNMFKNHYKFDYGFSKTEVNKMLGNTLTDEIMAQLEIPELPGRYHPARTLKYLSTQTVTWHIPADFKEQVEIDASHQIKENTRRFP